MNTIKMYIRRYSFLIFGVSGLSLAMITIVFFRPYYQGTSSIVENVFVDLGIGDTPGLGQPGIMSMTEPSSRPGVLVAWRNTEKVLEIEVLAINRGNSSAKGRLEVEILDSEHNVLAKQPPKSQPFVINIPSASAGGVPGITVQIPGTYNLNRMLDQLDRAQDAYCLRVRIETLEVPDIDLLNNTAIKCYNTSAQLRSYDNVFHRFYLRNTGETELEGTLLIQMPEMPNGWTLQVEPKPGSRIKLKPGQLVIGMLLVRAETEVQEGDYLDIRPVLVDSSNHVLDGSEFYVAADSKSPEITRAIVAPGNTPNSVYLVVRAIDSVSGVAEASGASVEWSTDAGFTMNKRTLTYQDGNFLSPTGFDSDLGPFAPGTEVRLMFAVKDVVGNTARTEEIVFQIPLTEVIEIK